MPAAAAVGIGAASGLLQAHGARKAAKAGARATSPQAVRQRYEYLNPEFNRAYTNQTQYNPDATPYEKSLAQYMQNPGQLDPRLMNQSFHLSAQRTPSDIYKSMSMVGGGAIPGLAMAIPAAMYGAQTMRDVGTANQFTLAQAQLLRSDIQDIERMRSGMLEGSFGQQAQQGQYASAITPWSSILGNAMQGGLAAYGTLGTMGKQGPPTSEPYGKLPQGGYDFNKPVQEQPWNQSFQSGTPLSAGGVLPQPSIPSANTMDYKKGMAGTQMMGAANPWGSSVMF